MTARAAMALVTRFVPTGSFTGKLGHGARHYFRMRAAYHEDHFSASDVLRLLEARPGLQLYAPAQAVAGMREIAPDRLGP